jgi:hypothetical protein
VWKVQNLSNKVDVHDDEQGKQKKRNAQTEILQP